MTRDWQTKVGWILSAVVVLLGIRAAYLLTLYLSGYPGAARYQVESASTIFVAVGALAQILRRSVGLQHPPRPFRFRFPTWAFFCLVALALYQPALGVGFLSDDYLLVERAGNWDFSAFSAQGFRPLPLFIWAVILNAGGSATALHLMNVILHGTNAYLTFRIADALLPRRDAALGAGLLMATLPIHVEAVTWISGVFDLTVTAFALSAVLIARGYSSWSRPGRRVGLYLVIVAAALSKETAVIVPLLIAIDAWSRRDYPRALIVDCVVITAVTAAYAGIRLAWSAPEMRQPLTQYVVQKYLFGTFGGLAVPWHVDVVSNLPLLPLAGSLVVIVLLCAFFVSSDNASARVGAAFAGWVPVAALPTIAFLFISPTLEGSRYLYLSAVGWSIVILAVAMTAHAATAIQNARHAFSVFAVVVLIGLGAVGVRLHVAHWRQAADLRESVELAARDLVATGGCTSLTLADLPDSVQGAYVFRNGAPEAFLRDLGISARLGSAGPCSFRWDGERFVSVE